MLKGKTSGHDGSGQCTWCPEPITFVALCCPSRRGQTSNIGRYGDFKVRARDRVTLTSRLQRSCSSESHG